MDNEELKSLLGQMDQEFRALKEKFFSVANGQAKMDELEKAISRYLEKRQKLFNNAGLGLVVGFENLVIAPFRLTGNIMRDVGQVNKSNQTE